MNSSRLRSVSAAPKLAITMMMTELPSVAQAAEQQRIDQQAPARRSARLRASAPIGSAQPNENGPIGASSAAGA